MKILVIGSGGREHALAWRLAQSPKVSRVYVAPGNAGTAREDGLFNVDITAIPDLVRFAKDEGIHATVVGPEGPLAAGVVDAFKAEGLRIFGPTRAAAQLESSKDFAKRFMQRHGIPTAQSRTFTDSHQARAYIAERGVPIVIKADGLAAGKGVVVATQMPEAVQAVEMMLSGNKLGEAGHRVVIEDFMEGEEASFIVMVDGTNVLPLPSSQDHKRIFDGDKGPNTGGMGAYSPAPVVTPEVHNRVMREIIAPAVKGMASEEMPYVGFLYAGLMIDAQGAPRVVEFNCRLGDPETQPILMRLKSDLLELVDHAIDGTLDRIEAQWDRRAALGVVLAAAGYPDTPRKGDAIRGLPRNEEDFHVFHSGTNERNGNVLTHGGRVLCVTALGDKVKIAAERAYDVIEGIRFEGMQFRHDIGHRAFGRR
ncbi:MAG TPA: phosphoribosylamine--glycine ligase [Usitatibacter sp.]|jgi:phosphoribosylamine--glycine ligase|nr:phosphoribosylamine--glycine ligase [Usitatibacter sp.]